MRFMALGGVVVVFCFLFSCKNNAKDKGIMKIEEYQNIMHNTVQKPTDISLLFPKTVEQVHAQVDAAVKVAREEFDAMLAIAPEDRTFDNTVRALDVIVANFSKMTNSIQLLTMVSPDKAIRDACLEAAIKTDQAAVDFFIDARLYKSFRDYIHGRGATDNLNAEERYYLDETMNEFLRQGLHLPEDQLLAIKELEKEVSALKIKFEKNIAEDKSQIEVTLAELQGVDEHFIKSLTKNGDQYILRCDYPTFGEVMANCSIETTRRDLYRIFQNRAYPHNNEVLGQIISLRDQLAKMVDFKSFAAQSIAAEMAKTPERVEQFITQLAMRARGKMLREFQELTSEMPAGATLEADGKIKPWDYNYIKAEYKKKHFDLDERKIAEYFPVKKALDGMLSIYQDFFGLQFNVCKADWVWHEDVQFIEILDKKSGELLGYLYLDLYPRDDKYSHACMVPLIQPQKKKNLKTGGIDKNPSVTVVIANFPKSSGDRPALLKYDDVSTFFHEFGHAMHGLLGRTEIASLAGTSVKRDFVELPSQMFEEWMFEKEMLNRVSEHYQTKEPLPVELIEKKIALKKFDSGYFVVRQSVFSLLSLACYQDGAHKDLDALVQSVHQQLMPEIAFDESTHFQASFGHLTGYGARYYGYLWSRVFALDIFDTIKKLGLSDPQTGKKFADAILVPGGSKDPNELMKDFLGREANQDAFLRDLGL